MRELYILSDDDFQKCTALREIYNLHYDVLQISLTLCWLTSQVCTIIVKVEIFAAHLFSRILCKI